MKRIQIHKIKGENIILIYMVTLCTYKKCPCYHLECLYLFLDDGETSDACSTPTKRSNNNQIVGYLREKTQQEMDKRKQDIEMRKEELKLQKEKFELERQERLQKLETEKQEKKLMFELLNKCLGNKM